MTTLIQDVERRMGMSVERYLQEAMREKKPVSVIAIELGASTAEVEMWLGNFSIGHQRPSHPRIEALLVGYLANDVTREPIHEQPLEDQNMTGRLSRSFFEQSAIQVAKGLLGRYVYVEQAGGSVLVARLRSVAAYEGAARTTSEGAYEEAGTVSVSTKFGRQLVDIATGKSGRASCVTLRAADITIDDAIEQIRGPGNLAHALGITRFNKDAFLGLSACGRYIWIEGDPITTSLIKQKKGNAENCQGIYSF